MRSTTRAALVVALVVVFALAGIITVGWLFHVAYEIVVTTRTMFEILNEGGRNG